MTIEKLSIALPTELAELIRQSVASGQYASTSEVIRQALREWNLRQSLRDAEIEYLRRAWTEGVASGSPVPFDLDRTLAAARARLSEK